MTLTLCLQGKDGIVVAADSRGTFGDPRHITAQNDTIKKVYLVGNVGILEAGSSHANMIVEGTHLVKLELLSNAPTIDSALNYIRSRQSQQKGLALDSANKDDDEPSHKYTVF
jgi:20S proteasome alpha/beta subunit